MRLIARRRDQVIVKEVRSTYGDVPVGPNDVVLDLGANIGASGRLFLDKGAGKLIAIEPDPTSALLAQRNLKDKRATLIWAAVGPARGRMTFYPSKDRPYLSSSLPAKGRHGVMVPVLTLGSLFAQYRPTIVKCDIEFGEYALPELYALPDFVRVLAMELHVRKDLVVDERQDDEALTEQRQQAVALMDSFAAQGFTIAKRKDKHAKSGAIKDETGLGPLVKSIDAIWTR